jgi:hypothetical protein
MWRARAVRAPMRREAPIARSVGPAAAFTGCKPYLWHAATTQHPKSHRHVLRRPRPDLVGNRSCPGAPLARFGLGNRRDRTGVQRPFPKGLALSQRPRSLRTDSKKRRKHAYFGLCGRHTPEVQYAPLIGDDRPHVSQPSVHSAHESSGLVASAQSRSAMARRANPKRTTRFIASSRSRYFPVQSGVPLGARLQHLESPVKIRTAAISGTKLN